MHAPHEAVDMDAFRARCGIKVKKCYLRKANTVAMARAIRTSAESVAEPIGGFQLPPHDRLRDQRDRRASEGRALGQHLRSDAV